MNKKRRFCRLCKSEYNLMHLKFQDYSYRKNIICLLFYYKPGIDWKETDIVCGPCVMHAKMYRLTKNASTNFGKSKSGVDFQCGLCFEYFPSMWDLQNHIDPFISLRRGAVCGCGIKFWGPAEFANHAKNCESQLVKYENDFMKVRKVVSNNCSAFFTT